MIDRVQMVRGLLLSSMILVLGACGVHRGTQPQPAHVGSADVLLIAPHPDDETLMAAGVIARERAAGRRVAVAVVTNGDLSCDRNGLVREAETIAAMALLGVREEDIFFLGYPDGHLDELGHLPLAPVTRLDRDGRCVTGNTTYAGRGAGGTDVHTLLTGKPAPYTSDSLVSDLAALIERLRPYDIYVSHPIDEHPDHASVYAYLRRALERRAASPPRIHRAIVHIGGCWPNAAQPEPCPAVIFAPGDDAPPLPSPLDVYRPGERIAVPPAMLARVPAQNPKYMAIATYASQTGPATRLSYLFSFARAREPFYPETLEPDGPGRLRRSAPLAPAVEGARVRCRVVDAEEKSAFEIAHTEKGSYGVRMEPTALVLERQSAGEAALSIGRWRLPRSAAPARHTVEVLIELRPDDGGVAEITLRRDGELLGVAVDPRPLLDQGAGLPARSSTPEHLSCERY